MDPKLIAKKIEYPGYANIPSQPKWLRDAKERLNCRDEIVPGSHKRNSEFRQLMQKRILIGSPNFMEQLSAIVIKMRGIMKEEYMAITGCSEREIDYWIEWNVDFTHMKKHVDTAGNTYLSVDPKIGNKYIGFNPKLKE